jgi:hypothetical protein
MEKAGAELSADECLVRDWLRERGYPEPEYEPRIVADGRRPDFLASTSNPVVTPNLLWAEVKSLQPDNTAIGLAKISHILRGLDIPKGINGYAILHVTEASREQSVRALVKMFISKVHAYASEQVRLIFVQQASERTDVRHAEVQGQIAEKVWVRGAGDRRIAVPTATIEDDFALTTHEIDGRFQTLPAFRVFDTQTSFDCALVANINPNDLPLTSISSMSAGSSTLSGRALRALEEANSQLRNAFTFKGAPGVVFIVPAEEYADDIAIAIAAYGKLTVPFSGATSKFGDAFHGDDGAFRPGKNTHISAAIRLRRNGDAATFFPNPFARPPIDEMTSLFRGVRRAPVRFE